MLDLPRRVALVAPPSMMSGLVTVTVARLPWEPEVTLPGHRPESRPHRVMPAAPPRAGGDVVAERIRWIREALQEGRDE